MSKNDDLVRRLRSHNKYFLPGSLADEAADAIERGAAQGVTDEMVERAVKVLNARLDVNEPLVGVSREMLTAALPTPPAPAPDAGEELQARVQPWMMACFGPEISADKLERSDRFIEEALELVQSVGYSRDRVLALVDYVYGREPGEPFQEVGGVMITLAAFCLAHGMDMHEAGEAELARIWTKVEKIRAKQAAKPTGSALPIPTPQPPAVEAEAVEIISEVMRQHIGEYDKPIGEGGCPRINWYALRNELVAALKAKTDEIERLRRERDGGAE